MLGLLVVDAALVTLTLPPKDVALALWSDKSKELLDEREADPR